MAKPVLQLAQLRVWHGGFFIRVNPCSSVVEVLYENT
jgi:hypothetical protein